MKRIVLSIIVFIAAIVLTMAFYLLETKAPSSEYQTTSIPLPQATYPVTPMPTSTPTPMIIPTSTPSPTQIPFSYYAPTTVMTFEELVGDNSIYEQPKGYPAPDTYRIIVDKTFQVVIIYSKDDEGNYTIPVRYMLCSTGKKTPVGEFTMKRYKVRFGFFQNDKTFGQYWSLINGRIYFHSILYTERNNASSYIEEPYSLLGTPASHGCIRLTVPDARFIYYNIAYGTVVEIREGDPTDELTERIRKQLILAPLPSEHITILPEKLPYTDNWHIDSVRIDIPYEEGTQKGQE